MNIVYLQADCRFNQWLFQEISGKYVIDHTLEKIKKLDCEKIVAGIYDCKENEALMKALDKIEGGRSNNIRRGKCQCKIC